MVSKMASECAGVGCDQAGVRDAIKRISLTSAFVLEVVSRTGAFPSYKSVCDVLCRTCGDEILGEYFPIATIRGAGYFQLHRCGLDYSSKSIGLDYSSKSIDGRHLFGLFGGACR